MASSTVLSRLSSRLKPLALKLNKNASKSANTSSLIKSTSQSRPSISGRRIYRLPVELSSLESMMPSHSAIASARLRSSLSTDSQCWGLIPQGISLPL
ncbi:protein NUCLEAR FUSION DEFECTIVE 6, mitochondrial-like [Cornus florida]|uniref:protein NUCLEAR FUSION DEFECTIVE 6, mitochondrial-like n=1 Tax=Cornus florida TaxID=4283 RepID=UPI00289E27D2|nr:protein NUCLEAR FUSION DEFECTIVE 6, mitochondrial-like [Cornus florida]